MHTKIKLGNFACFIYLASQNNDNGIETAGQRNLTKSTKKAAIA